MLNSYEVNEERLGSCRLPLAVAYSQMAPLANAGQVRCRACRLKVDILSFLPKRIILINAAAAAAANEVRRLSFGLKGNCKGNASNYLYTHIVLHQTLADFNKVCSLNAFPNR